MSHTAPPVESFTPDERDALAPYFGNTDSPVFVLTNLPEVVKGALFARYSRSAKSARRLFLDEFRNSTDVHLPSANPEPGSERAARLYERVLSEYGDDSVAQLGGAHIACEGVSNVLTKVLERGRLMSYLEQSTRYVPYTDRPNGQWKYVLPAEIEDPADAAFYAGTLDRAFETYAHWLRPMQEYYRRRNPIKKATKTTTGDSVQAYDAAIRAQALDTLRGLLPAATRSNVGVYGSGQGYEALLLRMRAHRLAESRNIAAMMLRELRKVIPAFLQRVDKENRGIRWTDYLRTRDAATRALARDLVLQLNAMTDTASEPSARDEVALVDHDPDGEIKVVAAALYAASQLPYDQLLHAARNMTTDERTRVLSASVSDRRNRRHRPGRAFEHSTYTFDILSDYGAFRDLQRHRMLTIDWQELTTDHGFTRSNAIEETGALSDWERVMDEAAELHERLAAKYSTLVAQYAVSMAYRVRFHMRMNAREAMHVIELRTAPQGHAAYRRVCQKMHDLIAEHAQHRAIAAAMMFVDHSQLEAERLEAARRRHQPVLMGIPWSPGRLLNRRPPQSAASLRNETQPAPPRLAGLDDN